MYDLILFTSIVNDNLGVTGNTRRALYVGHNGR